MSPKLGGRYSPLGVAFIGPVYAGVITVDQAKFASDTGVGTDSISVIDRGNDKFASDSGVGTDSVSVRSIGVADTGVGSDSATVTKPIVPGGVEVPDEPGPHIVIAPRLPKVAMVISSNQGIDFPSMADWFWEEEAPGGLGPSGAVIDARHVLEKPEVYKAGAIWQLWASDECVWEGELANVVIQGAIAKINGRGWKYLADRDAERMLFMDYPDMQNADSDPFNYRQDDSWEVDASGSRIVFTGKKGTETKNDDEVGVVFWAEDIDLQKLSFTIVSNGNGGASDLRVMTGTGPGPRTDLVGRGTIPPTNEGKQTIQLRNRDLFYICIIRQSTAVDFNVTAKTTLQDVKVYALARDDDMSFAQVARHVVARLGVEDYRIEETGDNMMPLDYADGTYGGLLDLGALNSATRWLFLSEGNGPVCEIAEYTKRTWYTSVNDGATELIPASQFNRVIIQYQARSGRTRKAIAEPHDIDMDDPYKTTGWINAYTVVLDRKFNDDKEPRALAIRLLERLLPPRRTGSFSRAFVRNSLGMLFPAYFVLAGDTIVFLDVPDEESGIVMAKIQSKHASREGGDFQLEEGLLEADSLVSRRKGTASTTPDGVS